MIEPSASRTGAGPASVIPAGTGSQTPVFGVFFVILLGLLGCSVARAQATPVPLITLEELSAVGSFDDPEAMDQAQRHLAQIAFCARLQVPIPAPESSSVRMELSVRFGRLRRVLSLDAPGSEEAQQAFQRCLEHRLGAWRFPFGLQGTVVTLEARLSRPTDAIDSAAQASELPGEPSVEQVMATLEADGRLYEIDAHVLAVLRQRDPCEGVIDEFERIRCERNAPAAVAEARAGLATDFVLISDIRGWLGAYDVDAGVLPVEVDPVLVPGGLGSAAFPSLTLGRLTVEEQGAPGAFKLVSAEPRLSLSTPPLSLEDAERLVRMDEGQLRGRGLVRLEETYESTIRTEFWYLEQRDPAAWKERQAAGLAEPRDRFLGLYSISVALVAVVFDEPETGRPVLSWVAPDHRLDRDEQGQPRLSPVAD